MIQSWILKKLPSKKISKLYTGEILNGYFWTGRFGEDFYGWVVLNSQKMAGSIFLALIELQPNVLLYFKRIYMVTNR